VMEIKICGISGSETGGKTYRLLEEALHACQKFPSKNGLEDVAVITQIIDLGITILPPMRTGQRSPATPPSAVREILSILTFQDGFLFASPVRWFAPSARMQILLEWMDHLEAPNFPLTGRPAGFLAVCEEDGGQQAVSAMAAVAMHLGMIIPPHAAFFVNTNMAEKSEDQWMLRPEVVGENVVAMILRLRGAQVPWSQ